jgi:hypothetical protein
MPVTRAASLATALGSVRPSAQLRTVADRSWGAMKLPTIRPRASAFCCDCGERITDETRAPTGGPRCASCRALRRPRPGLVPALALTIAGAGGFGLGRLASPSSPVAPTSTPAPAVARIPPSPERAPAPPEDPLHPCGARTKRGTPCKRLVRGPGHCWQHGGAKGANGTKPTG